MRGMEALSPRAKAVKRLGEGEKVVKSVRRHLICGGAGRVCRSVAGGEVGGQPPGGCNRSQPRPSQGWTITGVGNFLSGNQTGVTQGVKMTRTIWALDPGMKRGLWGEAFSRKLKPRVAANRGGSRWGARWGARWFVCAAVVFIHLLMGCTSTSVLESRKVVGASVDLDQLHKVLVVARNADAPSRKLAEERMAAYHEAFRVSYPEFSQKEVNGDERKFREELKARGYDGVLSLRFLGKGKETRYVPGTYFPGTYQSGTPGAPANYTPGYYLPGYYREETKTWIRVEVVSLRRNQLLWSGVTETTNASGVAKTVGEALEEVRRQMIKDELIRWPPKRNS